MKFFYETVQSPGVEKFPDRVAPSAWTVKQAYFGDDRWERSYFFLFEDDEEEEDSSARFRGVRSIATGEI